MKPTYKKSWARNLLVCKFDLGPLLEGQTRVAKLKRACNTLIIGPRVLGCENNQKEIMRWESSDMVIFDRGPLSKEIVVAQST